MNSLFNRDQMIHQIKSQKQWDTIVIGGGATGLGIALDAASRGYSVLLLEQADFAKGTSSRSTKLIHGGVRYLNQGNIQLVYDAVRERGLLLQNAPHLVKKQSFIIPCYSWLSVVKYFTGLKIYDWLAGFFSLGSSRFVSKKVLLQLLPGVKSENLVGGIMYFDAQFDDARLAINLAQTCIENGGIVMNYCKVTGLLKSGQKVSGVQAIELESGMEYVLHSKVVVNATGVFVDDVIRMDQPENKPLVNVSQGVHLVFDQSFLNNDHALLVPKTSDGRVLFAVPWHHHVLVGTTDTPLYDRSLEPIAFEREISFIIDAIQHYLKRTIKKEEVLSVFAGLRPLVASQKDSSTKDISRDHKLVVSKSRLITITGGKWTTYRRMAEDAVDAAIKVGALMPESCNTKNIKIHGYTAILTDDHLCYYGSDANLILKMIKENPALDNRLVETFPHMEAEIVWSVRNEMARTVEDVLARRLRILFLDAKAAIQAAPRVASIMASELQYGRAWEEEQVANFTELARHYLFSNYKLSNELARLHLSA